MRLSAMQMASFVLFFYLNSFAAKESNYFNQDFT